VVGEGGSTYGRDGWTRSNSDGGRADVEHGRFTARAAVAGTV